MPSNYTGNAAAVTAGAKLVIADPVDGDPPNAALFTTPMNALADYGEYLYEQLLAMAVSNWYVQTSNAGANQLNGICSNGSTSAPLMVAVGEGGKIVTSPDGIVWTAQTSGTTDALKAVAYNGTNLFVAAGGVSATSMRILSSPDGVTWTSRLSAGAQQFLGVAYSTSLSLWCAVGQGGIIYTSPDGTTWTSRTSGTTDALSAVTFGAGVFCAMDSTTAKAFTSATGTGTWTQQTTQGTSLAATFANSLFVATNGTTGFQTSPDGVTWTNRGTFTWPSFTSVKAIAHNGRQFCAVGQNPSCGSSLDGLTWKGRTAPAFVSLGAGIAAHPAGFFIAVGVSSGNGAIYTSLQMPAI